MTANPQWEGSAPEITRQRGATGRHEHALTVTVSAPVIVGSVSVGDGATLDVDHGSLITTGLETVGLGNVVLNSGSFDAGSGIALDAAIERQWPNLYGKQWNYGV